MKLVILKLIKTLLKEVNLYWRLDYSFLKSRILFNKFKALALSDKSVVTTNFSYCVDWCDKLVGNEVACVCSF